MQLISHRGNLIKPDLSRENQIWAIEECIKLGYKVEVDLWAYEPIDDNGFRLYLTHDEPTGKCGDKSLRLDITWLLEHQNSLLVHCKNRVAVEYAMSELDGEWFVHDKDRWAGTSYSHLICYCEESDIIDEERVLLMMPEHHNINEIPKGIYGVCTDFVEDYAKKYNTDLSN